MSKKCAACGKTVYPVEELKCLEKIWHKACFKCQVCGMTLNMKNYKGFDKLPYCNAHVPKAKATVVADTPENLRLKANSEVNISFNFLERSIVDCLQSLRTLSLSSGHIFLIIQTLFRSSRYIF